MKKYIVYRITEKASGRFYIGYHGTEQNDPLQDLGVRYFTSGKLREAFESDPSAFDRQILFQGPSRGIAWAVEQDAIARAKRNPLCVNVLCATDKLALIESFAEAELKGAVPQARPKKVQTPKGTKFKPKKTNQVIPQIYSADTKSFRDRTPGEAMRWLREKR